jgi:hypothetical protein
VGGFFQELAKILASRWLGLLVLPGAFFLGAVWVAVNLGQAHAWDVPLLVDRVGDTATSIANLPAGAQFSLAVAVLAAASGAGLVVQALAGVTRRSWLGQWPWPFGALATARTASRRARWHRLVESRHALEQANPRTRAEINALADRTNRLALAEPGRPTWMGDRIHAAESVAYHRYGLDLTFGWSRLWLVLPETTRAELAGAHATFAAAVVTGTWALPYLVLTVFWWPAALVAVGIGTTGWARARAAVADLSTLTEAAVDLHGRALASAFGVGDPADVRPLTPAEGQQITDIVRKGR